MAPITPTLPESFFSSVLNAKDTATKVRWYMCVIVNLSSLNYADVIPQVYSHLEANLLAGLSHDDQFKAVQQIQEGLVKSLGIAGAARTGNGLRVFAKCTPGGLLVKESLRLQETEATAIRRGKKFFSRVYDKNPLFKPEVTARASPDYWFIVKDIIYGRLFSFDAILDDLTSAYAMVSALYGMNSPDQLRNHMIGMQLNGADKQSLQELQDLLLGLGDILGVKFRFDRVPIPDVPSQACS